MATCFLKKPWYYYFFENKIINQKSCSLNLSLGLITKVQYERIEGIENMTILQDLYYGNITPIERGFRRVESIKQQRILKAEDEFKVTLTAEQKEKWGHPKSECWAQYRIWSEAFGSGFKLATKIMMEAIRGKKQPQTTCCKLSRPYGIFFFSAMLAIFDAIIPPDFAQVHSTYFRYNVDIFPKIW